MDGNLQCRNSGRNRNTASLKLLLPASEEGQKHREESRKDKAQAGQGYSEAEPEKEITTCQGISY